MASDFSVTDQSVSELTGVKKLGDDTKEEEKYEPEDASVADEINKEEEHKQVSSSSESAAETNEGKSNDAVEICTSKEPVNSAFNQEDLEFAEVAQTSENEIKPQSSSDKVEIQLVESEDSKDDVNELMHTEVPAVVFPNAFDVPEEIDVGGTLTSISVPVKNLEAESGSPEEHKPEESAETKTVVELIKSEDAKGEVHELVPAEICAVDSEAPEENNADKITPTALEVTLKDPESYAVSLEEKKPEELGETKEHVESSMSEDSKEEVHELVPIDVSINGETPEISDVDSRTCAIVEVPVKDFEVESSSPEEQKAEVGAESEVKELIKSGYSKEEGQELVSDEVPTDISEAVKKNDVNLGVPTSAEVPLKDLEVESGSPEEQKLEESVETMVNIKLIESGELKDGHNLVSGEVSTNTSEAPKENDVDSSAPTSTVVPVRILEIESSSPGEQKAEEDAETKVNIELTEPGDSKVEGQELVSAEAPASTSEVPKINDVDLSTTASTKVAVNDLEIESGSPDERKPKEGPETKVNIELIEPGDSKYEGREPVSSEVHSNNSEEFEKNDVDSSTPTSIEVPVKDLEVESGSPTEQKLEESAETKVNIEFIKSGESKEEDQDLFSSEVSSNRSEAPKIDDTEFINLTSTEVHVKELEVGSSSIEEQKLEESEETKVVVDLIESGDSKDEGQESVSSKVLTDTSEEPENNNVDSSSTSIDVPAEDLEVESGSPEEQKIEEISETKVNIKLIESGDSEVEGQESVSAEVPASTSEEPEDTTDLSTPTGIEVPLKGLEVESGSPEEQKIVESAETKVNTHFIKSSESKDEGQASGEVPCKVPGEVPCEEVPSEVLGEVPGEIPTSSSQAPEINDVDLSIPASTEVVKDLEIKSGSPEEQKPEEVAETIVNIKLIESDDSKVEGKESVSAEIPASTSEELEDTNTDLSTPASIEVPVKDLEVESGHPEEKKIEGTAELKVSTDFIKSEESKDEGQASSELPTSSSQAPEINGIDLSIPTSTEAPVEDLEVDSGSPEEQKPKEGAETKVKIKLTESVDSEVEGQESVSDVPASTSEEPEDSNTDLSTPTNIEVPVKDLEVESGSPEEQKIEESAEIKVNIDFIKSEESKDENKTSDEFPTSFSQAPEINDVVLSIPASTEVPVKDLEVESGSPEEQKLEESAEIKVNKLIDSGDSKVEDEESVSVPANASEEFEDSNNDLSTPTGIEVPVKDLEVESGHPEEKKIEGIAEIKVSTDFIKSGELNDEVQASGEVPTSSSQAPEINDVDSSIPASKEVPVKDLEIESDSPEEQKPEEDAETKVNIQLIESCDSKVEGEGSVSAEVPASTFEELEDTNTDFSTPTSIEVPVKDLEVESGHPEEKKIEGTAELKVSSDFNNSGKSKNEGEDLVSSEVPTNTSEEAEINAVDSSAPTSTEAPVKDLEVEYGSPEEQKPAVNTSYAPENEDVELSTPTSTEVPLKDLEVTSGSPEEQKLERSVKTNLDIESIKLGDSKDEGQESVFAEVPTNVYEEHELYNVARTSMEVPVNDLEVESGSAQEQNPKESVETKEQSSDVTTIDDGGEVAGSYSYEDKSSGVGEVADKEDEGFKEEVIHTRIEEDQILDEDKVSEAVAAKKGDEIAEDGIEGSTVLDVVLPVTEVFPGEVVEERKDETSEVDNTDIAPKVSEVSLAGGNVLEAAMNVEAIERDFGEISTDPTAAGGVLIGQAKTPENVEVEPLELKFEQLDVSPETSEPSVEERFSAVDEKSESSKGGERKDEISEVDNTSSAPNVSGVSSVGGNVLAKDVNAVAIERDLAETSIDSTVGGVSTEQAKNPENVEVEPLELKFGELNVSPEASEVHSVGERVSASDEKSESSKGGETKDEIFEADNTDSTPNVSEVSSSVGNVLEKDVNAEAIDRDLAETSIDSTVDEVSTEQAKIPEYVEAKPLELKFDELNPEASQVPSVGERVSAGDGKSESSKGETVASLVETPKDIATSDMSLAHLDEETENESSKSDTEASVEQFPEAVKEIIASESYNEKKDEISRDVSLEEKNVNVNQDEKSAVKVKGVIENAPGPEELGIEKREDEKPKDEELIISSDTRDVKLIKEVTKRDSNIFAKMKRSIIKAKKAILGKSPGSKTISSESKDVNI